MWMMSQHDISIVTIVEFANTVLFFLGQTRLGHSRHETKPRSQETKKYIEMVIHHPNLANDHLMILEKAVMVVWGRLISTLQAKKLSCSLTVKVLRLAFRGCRLPSLAILPYQASHQQIVFSHEPIFTNHTYYVYSYEAVDHLSLGH